MSLPRRHLMTKRSDPPAQPGICVSTASRRAGLKALLFSGATLGTTLLMLGAAADPKLPPFKGE
jgi:hypothetical protein